jgi:sensor histidine kinase YesM
MERAKQSKAKQSKAERRKISVLVLSGLVFSFIGVFSYLYLTITITHYETKPFIEYFSVWIFILSAVSFLILGYLLLRLNNVFSPHYPYAYDGSGWLVLCFCITLLIVFCYNYLLQIAIELYVSKTTFSAEIFRLSDSRVTTLTTLTLIEMVIISLMAINDSARSTINLYRKTEELREFQQNAELIFLQKQLNPHFLFNSLNALLSEIDEDPDKAKIFVSRLADVYRYTLHVQKRRTVPLTDELRFLNAYVYVHKVRAGKGLVFKMSIPKNINLSLLQERYVPPLALQLLVENALKHNVMSERRPLEIKLEVTKDIDHIVVSNNIIPKRVYRNSLIGGLKNLSKRYMLLSEQDIMVQKKDGIFYVTIPLLKE